MTGLGGGAVAQITKAVAVAEALSLVASFCPGRALGWLMAEREL